MTLKLHLNIIIIIIIIVIIITNPGQAQCVRWTPAVLLSVYTEAQPLKAMQLCTNLRCRQR